MGHDRPASRAGSTFRPSVRWLALAALLAPAVPWGAGAADAAPQAGFEPVLMAEHREPVAVQVGPDGHLYVVSIARRSLEACSKLTRYLLDEEGEPTGEVELLHRWKRRGDRENAGDRPLGLVFDPAAAPDDLVAYLSLNRDPTTDPWGGRILRATLPPVGGEGGVRFEPKIVNLPVGFHEVNQLVFGPDGWLYICVGSTTTSGAPAGGIAGAGGAEFPEQLLSAAILRADVRSIEGTLDVQTADGGTYNPYAPGAEVRLFATAIRQVYDLAWHEGRLYGSVNQNDVSGRTGSCDGVPDLRDQRPPEFLAIFEEGRTYGFPNASRGECVLMGGRPTEQIRHWHEIRDYPVGVEPPPTFDPDLLHPIGSRYEETDFDIGGGSANGILSYEAPGPYQGRLIQSFFGGEGRGRIWSFVTGPDGRIVDQEPLRDQEGRELRIMDNLDLAQHPTGRLYVARYGSQADPVDGELWMLRPAWEEVEGPLIAHAPTPQALVAGPERPGLEQELEVWNGGDDALLYTLEPEASWLRVEPAEGRSEGPEQRRVHRIHIETAGLPVGVHHSAVAIRSGHRVERVPFSVTVRPQEGRRVLFLAGDADLSGPGDAALRQRLKALGFDVETRAAGEADAEATGQVDLILFSDTASSAHADHLAGAAVPVVMKEAWGYPYLEMTGSESGTDYGHLEGEQRVTILAPDHPIAFGLRGDVSVYVRPRPIRFGLPGGEAQVIAAVEGRPDRAVLFAYEQGAALADGRPAPARRVGIGSLRRDAVGDLSTHGWALFDGALLWTAGLTGTGPTDPVNRAPIVSAGASRSLVLEPDKLPLTLRLEGSVLDDGLPDPPGEVTVRWTPEGGSEAVEIEDPRSAVTNATFSEFGTYILRLTADDSRRTGTARTTISLDQVGNDPPTVRAFAERKELRAGEELRVWGEASDDGLPDPPGRLIYRWTQIGPGEGAATFEDPASAETTVRFTNPTTYNLRLVVSDGVRIGYDQFQVTVREEPRAR